MVATALSVHGVRSWTFGR